jgi:hypothetical protein
VVLVQKWALQVLDEDLIDYVDLKSNQRYSVSHRERCKLRFESLKKHKLEIKSREWWCMPIIPDILEVEVGRSWFEASPGKVSVRLSGHMAPVVERLPSKHEAWRALV